MRRLFFALLAGLLPVTALAAAPPGVTVQNPWMRYLLPGIPAGAYMVLVNNSDLPVVLTGAAAPQCESMMLHQSMNMGGTAMMMPVESLTVPAHGQAELVQGGYHLMCMHPRMKVGQSIAITLNFAGGAQLAVQVPVYGPAGPP